MERITTICQMPFELSAAGQKRLDELTASVEAHNLAVDTLKTDSSKLREEAESGFSTKHEAEAGKLREKRDRLLQDELVLRGKISEWLPYAGTTELWAYVDRAIASEEKARRDVEAKILAMGFIEERGRIAHFVGYHPTVSVEVERRNAMQGTNPHQAALSENGAATTAAERELNELRSRALQGIG